MTSPLRTPTKRVLFQLRKQTHPCLAQPDRSCKTKPEFCPLKDLPGDTCVFFFYARCTNNQCPYRHDDSLGMLRQPVEPSTELHPCLLRNGGICHYNERCVLQALPINTCLYHFFGGCEKGERCTSHHYDITFSEMHKLFSAQPEHTIKPPSDMQEVPTLSRTPAAKGSRKTQHVQLVSAQQAEAELKELKKEFHRDVKWLKHNTRDNFKELRERAENYQKTNIFPLAKLMTQAWECGDRQRLEKYHEKQNENFRFYNRLNRLVMLLMEDQRNSQRKVNKDGSHIMTMDLHWFYTRELGEVLYRLFVRCAQGVRPQQLWLYVGKGQTSQDYKPKLPAAIDALLKNDGEYLSPLSSFVSYFKYRKDWPCPAYVVKLNYYSLNQHLKSKYGE